MTIAIIVLLILALVAVWKSNKKLKALESKVAERKAHREKYIETLDTFRYFAKSSCKKCRGKGYTTAIMNDTGKRTDLQCKCSYKNMKSAVEVRE